MNWRLFNGDTIMINDIYYNPTIIFFGKGVELKVGEEVAKYSKKILLHYDDVFKKYGLYDKVTASLNAAGVSYIELGGVKPNPCVSLVYKGIELCRKEGIDFILAVGGGSVIDSAKAISIGVSWQGDFFDFFEKKQVPQKSLKVGTVSTIFGAGSESSASSVITHEEKELKLSCTSSLMIPVFSILNPEITYTLPDYYIASGIVDAISHVLERYFTNTTYVDCTDRIGEGIIKTLMKYALLVKDAPHNYDVRAEIMWACKLANDNTAGFGRKHDGSSHIIAHELGAIYDFAHGATIGVIFLAWMKYVYKVKIDRFVQFASRVFEIDTNLVDNEQVILLAIDKFKQFLKSIGMPVNLRELGMQDKSRFNEISNKCVKYMPSGTIGNFVRLSPQDIVRILKIAY